MSDEVMDHEEVTMDDLFNQEVDSAQVEETIRRSLPPVGTYTTNPDESPINVFVAKVAEKDATGRVTGSRRLATVTGMGTNLRGGEEFKARLRFKMSPDLRKAREYVDGEATGNLLDKDDLASRLWAQAVQAYHKTNGSYPQKENELLEWLKSAPFKARIFHTRDGEIMVVAITAANQR